MITQEQWLKLQLKLACLQSGAIDRRDLNLMSECRPRVVGDGIELSYTMHRDLPYKYERDHAAVERSACSVLSSVTLPSWFRELRLELDVDFNDAERGERTLARALAEDFSPANCLGRGGFSWSTPRIPYDAP